MTTSSKTGKSKKKKKKFIQSELTDLFNIHWKHIKGIQCSRSKSEGITSVEAIDAESAKSSWLIQNNVWGRKYKVIKVEQVTHNTNHGNDTDPPDC